MLVGGKGVRPKYGIMWKTGVLWYDQLLYMTMIGGDLKFEQKKRKKGELLNQKHNLIFIAKLSSSWPVQCKFNWELRLAL